MYVCVTCVCRCLTKPEEGRGTGVTSCCEWPDVSGGRTEPRPLPEQQALLSAEHLCSPLGTHLKEGEIRMLKKSILLPRSSQH